MIHLHEQRYEYMEEVNQGILRHLPACHQGETPMVLDVGCGRGALAEAIRGRGYAVWGIEENPAACEVARVRTDRAIECNLNQIEQVKAEIGGERFDIVVFSDVLEHVYDPFSVLKGYQSVLKPGGRVLISVPNVAVWTNRLALMAGRFDYRATGVMDRTHIRFFTFKTASELVEAAGFTGVKMDYTPFLVRAALPLIKKLVLRGRDVQTSDRRQLVDSPWFKRYQKYVYPVEYALGHVWMELLAFRIIVTGALAGH
jgi:2-polyprenyl-3-methyl-5-hydroxy-6-metoxy-1,4-benzoquinol methylase